MELRTRDRTSRGHGMRDSAKLRPTRLPTGALLSGSVTLEPIGQGLIGRTWIMFLDMS
jgi:hypothetical protein